SAGEKGGRPMGVTPVPRLGPTQRSQLRREAVRNIEEGVYGTYGHNERSETVVRRIRERLEDDQTPIDSTMVERMVREIQNVKREEAAPEVELKPEADGSFIDPARLPPSYRQKIQQYFRKLSEQK
ncbi:MAG TPA: hypothetical protein PLV92_16790, partial [Pirellulaceae bacterium]|nr:hypothetical protein [Pirellulaceae bacterium]